MTSARIRALVALLLMMGSVAGAALWRPTERLADRQGQIELAQLFPTAFGAWRVDDRLPVQLVAPDQQALLDKLYNQTLTRQYINAEGDRVMLSVAYGGDQSDGTRAHRPEVCYPAQGFQLRSSTDINATVGGHSFPVRRLVTQLGGRVEPLSYWIVVGDTVAISGSQQKLAQLRYGMKGLIPDGLLVRVSTIDSDSAHSFSVQSQFLNDLAGSLSPGQRLRVFGAPSK